MARSVDDIYNFMRYIVRKERGVFLTTDEAMQALDNGQMTAYAEYFSQYGQNQTIHDAIRPFRIYLQFTSNTAGMVTFPADYLNMVGNPFTVTGSTVNTIKFVNEDELSFALTSQLRPVTNSYPIAVDTVDGFSIYPQQTQIGFMWYMKRPATPVYGVTEVGRVVTYDANTSTQLEWEDQYINNIIAKALKFVGVNMGEADVYNFADQYNKES